MGRFAMAWASRLCELHQSLPRSPIFFTTTSWDAHSARFLPPSHHRLPLPVDAELLVASVVHNFLLGESLIHVAIRKGYALLIGCFDADTLKFDVLVEVELPDFILQMGSHFTAEGYWLVDGPVIIVQVRENFLIVQISVCNALHSSETSFDVTDYDGVWHAFVLNFESVRDIKGMRALYCGQLGSFEGDDIFLSFQFSSKVDSQAVRSSRFTEGLNFAIMSSSKINDKICKGTWTSDMMWEHQSLEDVLEVCNELFPSDMCVDLISCIGFIPTFPDATLPNLAQDVKGSKCSYHDVVIGYWGGRIVKYRKGAVIAQADLNKAPASLQFAVVAEGQGILLCTLDGEEGTVAAICAETLLLLKAWPEFQDVIIGDFQMVGHDQILLLSESLGSETQFNVSGRYLIPQLLTDTKTCYFSTIQQFVPPEFSVEARDVHKTENVSAIASCLKSRMEAGLLQMRGIENQWIERAELAKSSCGLLQEIAIRDACSVIREFDDFHPSDLVGRVVNASIRQHGTCGRTWFLIVMVENVCQRAIVLQDLSLSLSTIGGLVSGNSSMIKSLSTADSKKPLVTVVSLVDFPDLSAYAMIHVLLSAKVCKENTTFTSTFSATNIVKEARGKCSLFKTWIAQIELRNLQMTGTLNPMAVPLEFREVAPKCTLVITESSRSQCVDVVKGIKEALRMAYRAEVQTSRVDTVVHELVASPGALWADATIISNGVMHIVTLRAEDFKHLSALKFHLLVSLKDKAELNIEASYTEFLDKTLCFLRVFKEEIDQRRSVLKAINEAALQRKSRESEDFKTSALSECEMQMHTDRQFCTLLAAMKSSLCSG